MKSWLYKFTVQHTSPEKPSHRSMHSLLFWRWTLLCQIPFRDPVSAVPNSLWGPKMSLFNLSCSMMLPMETRKKSELWTQWTMSWWDRRRDADSKFPTSKLTHMQNFYTSAVLSLNRVTELFLQPRSQRTRKKHIAGWEPYRCWRKCSLPVHVDTESLPLLDCREHSIAYTKRSLSYLWERDGRNHSRPTTCTYNLKRSSNIWCQTSTLLTRIIYVTSASLQGFIPSFIHFQSVY